MTDFVVAPQGVEPLSYVAIADGHKEQKMANVYAGFYDYDDATVECLKQRRVSTVLSVKPGNCGKHDSQCVDCILAEGDVWWEDNDFRVQMFQPSLEGSWC